MWHKPYREESLHPPATEDAAAAAATKWDWGEVLLDHVAYMVDKKNRTSTRCRFTRNLDGKEMDVQVTFCFAQPPRVSYFCCHAYFLDDHGEEDACLFSCEPYVFTTDEVKKEEEKEAGVPKEKVDMKKLPKHVREMQEALAKRHEAEEERGRAAFEKRGGEQGRGSNEEEEGKGEGEAAQEVGRVNALLHSEL